MNYFLYISKSVVAADNYSKALPVHLCVMSGMMHEKVLCISFCMLQVCAGNKGLAEKSKHTYKIYTHTSCQAEHSYMCDTKGVPLFVIKEKQRLLCNYLQITTANQWNESWKKNNTHLRKHSPETVPMEPSFCRGNLIWSSSLKTGDKDQEDY